MIDWVVDLVRYELNAAPRGDVMEHAQARLTDGGASRIVRRIYQDKLCVPIDKMHDLIRVNAEPVLTAQLVEPHLKTKTFRQPLVWRKTRKRNDDVCAGLCYGGKDMRQCLCSASKHEDMLKGNGLH